MAPRSRYAPLFHSSVGLTGQQLSLPIDRGFHGDPGGQATWRSQEFVLAVKHDPHRPRRNLFGEQCQRWLVFHQRAVAAIEVTSRDHGSDTRYVPCLGCVYVCNPGMGNTGTKDPANQHPGELKIHPVLRAPSHLGDSIHTGDGLTDERAFTHCSIA